MRGEEKGVIKAEQKTSAPASNHERKEMKELTDVEGTINEP